MNGDARNALRQVIRLTQFMRPGGLIVFTLKTPGADNLAGVRRRFTQIPHGKMLTIADARQHQQLWCIECAAAQNDWGNLATRQGAELPN